VLCLVFLTSIFMIYFFFSSRRRHTRSKRDWSSDVCSSDLLHRSYTPHSAQNVEYMTDATGEMFIRFLFANGRQVTLRMSEVLVRSEERRVGKECSCRGGLDDERKK